MTAPADVTAALIAKAQAVLDDAKAYYAANDIDVTDHGIVPELLAALAEQTQRAEAAEARVAELTAKLESAPVQMDAAHIRADALRDAAAVCAAVAKDRNDQIKDGRNKPDHVVDVPQQMRWTAGKLQAELLEVAILALIPTPAPSPDVGALAAEAVKAERERCAEMRRFIVAAMTHIRGNGDFKARDELLAWGARALAAQEGGDDPHS